MSEVTKNLRYRINICRGVKGGTSFEATVDAEGYTMKEVLDNSDDLVCLLSARYPPEIPTKKEQPNV